MSVLRKTKEENSLGWLFLKLLERDGNLFRDGKITSQRGMDGMTFGVVMSGRSMVRNNNDAAIWLELKTPMTQEEKKCLGKIKLWIILHPDDSHPWIFCKDVCPHSRSKSTCPFTTLYVKEDLTKCKMIGTNTTKIIEQNLGGEWHCIEWFREKK